MRTRVISVVIAVLGLAAGCGGSESGSDVASTADPAPTESTDGAAGDTATTGPDGQTATTTGDESEPAAIDSSDRSVGDTATIGGTGDEGESGSAGDVDDSVPAEQASPEAVVEAYFEAADANDPGVMFALISPDVRDGSALVRGQPAAGFTLASFTACVSDQLADISGADVAFEHSDTYVEDGSTFVEGMITLSEQTSDDLEVLRLPVAIKVVEIDGLWWTAGDKDGDADFSCAREGSNGSEPICTGDECDDESDESGDDDRGPVVDEQWTIALNEQSGGVYTLVMIKTFSPLEEADIDDLGGRLVWEESEIELCGVGIRSTGPGFVQIGDIFQTTEGCDGNTGMQQAFDGFGPPDTACVYVRVDGVDDEYCAPLTVGTADRELEL